MLQAFIGSIKAYQVLNSGEHLKDIEILYNMFFKRLEVVEERQVEIVVKEEPIEFELQKYIKKRKAKPKKE